MHELRTYSHSGHDKWPWGLVCYDETDNDGRQYNPKSDFFLALYYVPVIIAEVDSGDMGVDEARMLVQGASLVRLVNKIHRELESESDHSWDFVLTALYLQSNGSIIVYRLFQDGVDANDNVRTRFLVQHLNLTTPNSRYITQSIQSPTPPEDALPSSTRCTI